MLLLNRSQREFVIVRFWLQPIAGNEIEGTQSIFCFSQGFAGINRGYFLIKIFHILSYLRIFYIDFLS